MTATVIPGRALLLCVALVAAAGGCGKRGNPLPPLQRIPAAPLDLGVTRIDDQIYATVTVPTANVDGAVPPDVARIELYGVTFVGDPPPLTDMTPEALREIATLVAASPVRRPSPALPPLPDGTPAPPLPPEPGLDPGAALTARETLTPEMHAAVTVPDQTTPEAADAIARPAPLVAPIEGAGVRRYYFAVAVSARGRYGPATGLVPAPLGTTSGPPSRPVITVDESSMTLTWTPPLDARGVIVPPPPDVLPSRSLLPEIPPTTYDVYEAPGDSVPPPDDTLPVPLTGAPVGSAEYRDENITLGQPRCFYVRAVDIVDGIHVRGPASPVTCAPFTDTFAPAAPRELVAVSVPGAINLIWEPSEASDLAGYLVLRGEVGSATLTPVTGAPVTTLSYRDDTVQSGVRYIYAVVAVDRAGNRSDESNRVEETAP